jgi:hypothetical protein
LSFCYLAISSYSLACCAKTIHNRTIDLTGNGIGNEGLQYLAKPLLYNTHLERLILSGNQITNDSVIVDAEYVVSARLIASSASDSNLPVLPGKDVSGNAGTPLGLLSVNGAILTGTFLSLPAGSSIGVNVVRTPDPHAPASPGRPSLLSLCEALQRNTALIEANLFANTIGDEGAELVANVLRRRKVESKPMCVWCSVRMSSPLFAEIHKLNLAMSPKNRKGKKGGKKKKK